MGKKFYVEVDQKEIDVRAELPGNNCGGCGYAGCDALAKAIAAGEAQLTHVQLVAHRLQQRLVQSWVRKLENQ